MKIGDELKGLKVSKPLVVTDQGLVKFGIAHRLFQILDSQGICYQVFDQVPPDSSLSVVNGLAALYEQNACDGFVALGGGSVIDTTKGAAASLSCKGVDFATLQGSEILDATLAPIIAIPTTAGTGSEVTLVAVVADTERQVKLSFTSYRLVPPVAILDPALTSTLPPKLTATTGMDALTHAIEAYTSIQKNPVSDAFALGAIALIKENIFIACAEGGNADARSALALGSLMAGAAFSNAMVGIIHAIGHSLGGLCHIPHGQAMMLLLPHCIDHNIARGLHVGLYGDLLHSLDEALYLATPAEERATAFAQLIHRMNARFHQEYEVPINLGDLGVERSQFAAIAKQARYDGAALYNAQEISLDDVLGILEAAY
jgi:alcohol dehydrogenase